MKRYFKKSATIAINDKSRELIQRGKKIYKFGLGQSPFPVPNIMVKRLQEHAHEKDYMSSRGYMPLRQSIASYLNEKHGLSHFHADNIIVGPGSKELMYHIQLALDASLTIPKGSWVSYEAQARILPKSVHWIPSTIEQGYKMNLQNTNIALDDDTIAILNYPNNPTGATYNEDELKDLASQFRERRTVLLSDEIYGELHHDGDHVSIAKYYPERTIVSSGISKWLGAGGWRLGYVAIPNELSHLGDLMEVIASETFTSVPAPIQHASIAAFESSDEIDSYTLHCRRICKAIGQWIYATLSSIKGVVVIPPQGAFYITAHFDQSPRVVSGQFKNGEDMVNSLLEETGFACLPLSEFGADPKHFGVRMSYVDFDGEAALKAAQQGVPLDENFIRQYCSNTFEGILALKSWLEKNDQSL